MKHLITIVVFTLILNLCFGMIGQKSLTLFAADVQETKKLVVFAQPKDQPIRWYDPIPESANQNATTESLFVMNGRPGEIFVYQLGVSANNFDNDVIGIEFSDFSGDNGQMIPKEKNTCFSTGGTDSHGKPFVKEVRIKSGRLQSLWVGIDLENAAHGNYTGSVTVRVGDQSRCVPLQLEVSGDTIPNHGYDEGKRLARLNWLNSTAGIDEEVTHGYRPIQVISNTIEILGRKLVIAENGLPASIETFFQSSNQFLTATGEPIVEHAFRFVIEEENGNIVRLSPGPLTFVEKTPSKVIWRVLNTSEKCDLECTGQMEFDGFVDYRLKLTAKSPLQLKDVRLEIPITAEKAEYMMGLNHEGGKRTPNWNWNWNAAKNQDMLWVGTVNGGLRVKWKGENYRRPLVNIYYDFGKLQMPPSWYNDGKGGVNVGQQQNDVVINAYSGNREMQVGHPLHFDFELLVTPLKILDRQVKYGDRYYHGGGAVTGKKTENAKSLGANVLVIHHAEDIYPFINYPHVDENISELKQLTEKSHQSDIRLKLYYTTREMTKNLPEFWAFYSMDGEIFYPGPGNASRTEALHPNGPHPWLLENVRENYIPAWSNGIGSGKFKGETDLSVITTPDGRINNFYIAGLDWMSKNIGIDGIYIDDSALDRFTLRRARKTIDHYRTAGRIDLHSWNHFNGWAGYTNCLNLYMDLLPYADLVWIGEGRDYNRMPDHWLVEVSGIPFGLPGQMLEGGGNPWRGMVYGITSRAGWGGHSPVHLWRFFDEYQMAGREMIGYWQKDCPVTCDNPVIFATVYRGNNDLVVSVANWSDKEETATLAFDWDKIGLKQEDVQFLIPAIEGFQEEQASFDGNHLAIPGKKGYLIHIK